MWDLGSPQYRDGQRVGNYSSMWDLGSPQYRDGQSAFGPSRRSLGPTHPWIHWVLGTVYPGLRRLGLEADHSPPSSAEERHLQAPYAFMDQCCKAQLRDNFSCIYIYIYITIREILLLFEEIMWTGINIQASRIFGIEQFLMWYHETLTPIAGARTARAWSWPLHLVPFLHVASLRHA
jgi:hypothetical protein